MSKEKEKKLGAILSAGEFGTAAVLRNKFAHHYPDAVADRSARLNLMVEEADFVIGVFGEILAFMRRKGYLADHTVKGDF